MATSVDGGTSRTLISVPAKLRAPLGQASTQAPQRMQCASPSPALPLSGTASCSGQTSRQLPHWMQRPSWSRICGVLDWLSGL
jgi:hypothetical protein